MSNLLLDCMFNAVCFCQILQRVGPKTSHVIISSDGSWNAVAESDNSDENSDHDKISLGEDESSRPAHAMDPMQIDVAIDATNTHGTKGTKSPHKLQLTSQNATIANINDANQGRTELPINNQPNGQVTGASVATSVSSGSVIFVVAVVEVSCCDPPIAFKCVILCSRYIVIAEGWTSKFTCER